MLVAISTLKHQLGPKCSGTIRIPRAGWASGSDPADRKGRGINAIAIDAKHMKHPFAHGTEERDGFRNVVFDSPERCGAQMKPRPPRPQAVARAEPVGRRASSDTALENALPLAITRRGRLKLLDRREGQMRR